jgi:hypothetical protein
MTAQFRAVPLMTTIAVAPNPKPTAPIFPLLAPLDFSQAKATWVSAAISDLVSIPTVSRAGPASAGVPPKREA